MPRLQPGRGGETPIQRRARLNAEKAARANSKPAGWDSSAPTAQEDLHKHWEAGGHEITIDFRDDFDDDPPPDFLEIEEYGDYERDGYYERKVTKRFEGEDEDFDFGTKKRRRR